MSNPWWWMSRGFPPPPTRARVIAYQLTGQGLYVPLPGRSPTPFPWWDPALPWFTPEERALGYSAKHAMGDTHQIIDLPMGWPLYDEPGQAYSVQNGFGALDWTEGHRCVDSALINLLLDVIQHGFIPEIVLDEHLGFDGALAFLPILLDALAHGPVDLRQYCLIRPGWDGIF